MLHEFHFMTEPTVSMFTAVGGHNASLPQEAQKAQEAQETQMIFAKNSLVPFVLLVAMSSKERRTADRNECVAQDFFFR